MGEKVKKREKPGENLSVGRYAVGARSYMVQHVIYGGDAGLEAKRAKS